MTKFNQLFHASATVGKSDLSLALTLITVYHAQGNTTEPTRSSVFHYVAQVYIHQVSRATQAQHPGTADRAESLTWRQLAPMLL